MLAKQRIRGARGYVSQPPMVPGRGLRRAGLPARVGELAGSTSTHVVCAVVVMSGWVACANRIHGATAALTASLVQGGASALVMFTLKTALETMSRRLKGGLAFLLPPTVSCSVVITLLV